jgi:hypothetical protein
MESAFLLFFLGAIVARRKSNVVFLRVVELRSCWLIEENFARLCGSSMELLAALATSASPSCEHPSHLHDLCKNTI